MTSTNKKELPDSAEIIVIGGGIIGCSTAYHLALEGARDVLLLEEGQLSNGSTWHAAGLVGQLRSSANITQLLKYSVDLYQRLEQETGLATGWKMNGGLQLACNQDRWTELRRRTTTARSFDLPMQLLSPREAAELWPLMDASDVVGAAYLPTDGQVNPSDITQSLARGARLQGVSIFEDTAVTGVIVEHGRVMGITSTGGKIRCNKLVNCGGQWAKNIGAMAGVNVPLQSVEHQYMVTEP
ncbi:MAG TPA: FAD-binding oxidoreductase, partial [Gammaproteobacteria bacterium]|nr:FAD-binding oxidoreductase [Gammaproteobacteria bacterium]